MTLPVHSWRAAALDLERAAGDDVEPAVLLGAVFNRPVNPTLLEQVVRWQRAKRRKARASCPCSPRSLANAASTPVPSLVSHACPVARLCCYLSEAASLVTAPRAPSTRFCHDLGFRELESTVLAAVLAAAVCKARIFLPVSPQSTARTRLREKAASSSAPAARTGYGLSKDKGGGVRRRAKATRAEGHRPRSSGLESLAAHARRRRQFPAQAAQLRVQAAKEGACPVDVIRPRPRLITAPYPLRSAKFLFCSLGALRIC